MGGHGILIVARWTLAVAAVMLAPTVLPTAVLGQGTGAIAAIAIVAAVVALSVAAAGSRTLAMDAVRPAAPAWPGGEDQHRRGAFQRQHAPDTPGRPRLPRAPGYGIAGPAMP